MSDLRARLLCLAQFFLILGGIKASDVHPCHFTNMHLSLGPAGAGMGHAYNEVIFQNIGPVACHLSTADLLFQRLDGADAQSFRKTKGTMPTEVHLNSSVNMDGEGSPELILEARQRAAITTSWANRTGYGLTVLCATKVRIKMINDPGILLDIKTEACGQELFVSGFHAVGE